jgi:hypothetical protein
VWHLARKLSAAQIICRALELTVSPLRFISVWTRSTPQPAIICSRAEFPDISPRCSALGRDCLPQAGPAHPRAAPGVEALSIVDRGRRVDNASVDCRACLGCNRFSLPCSLNVRPRSSVRSKPPQRHERGQKSDWLPYAIAAELVAAISIDIWLLFIWFGV